MHNNRGARALLKVLSYLFICSFIYLLIRAHGIKVGSDQESKMLLPSASQFPSLEITSITSFLVIFLQGLSFS